MGAPLRQLVNRLENPRATFALCYPVGEEMEQLPVIASLEDFVMYPESVEKIIKASWETQDVADDLVAEVAHTIAVWFQLQAILVIVRKTWEWTEEAQNTQKEADKLKVLIEEYMLMVKSLIEEDVSTNALRALEEDDPTIPKLLPDRSKLEGELELLASAVLLSSSEDEEDAGTTTTGVMPMVGAPAPPTSPPVAKFYKDGVPYSTNYKAVISRMQRLKEAQDMKKGRELMMSSQLRQYDKTREERMAEREKMLAVNEGMGEQLFEPMPDVSIKPNDLSKG